MVKLHLKLGGGLAALRGAAELDLEVAEGVSLRQLAELAGLPPGAVMLYSVNGTVRPPEAIPADGDVVYLIPPVSGG